MDCGEIWKIPKLYIAIQQMIRNALSLFFIARKIINGKTIQKANQTMRVFSNIKAGIFIKIVKRNSQYNLL